MEFKLLKKIDKLIIRSFIGPFVITFFITLMVFILQFLWRYIDELIGKNLETAIILEFLALLSTTVVPEVLPLAVLLSAIMTFGSLGENYELVALKSSGISFNRFMRPLFIISIGIAIIAFLFSNYILPAANLKFTTLMYSINKQKPALNIKTGIFYDGIQGYVIKVGSKDDDNRTLHDILIYDHTKRDGSCNIISADRGEMYSSENQNAIIFKLHDGHQFQDDKPDSKDPKILANSRTSFKEYEMMIDLSNLDFEKKDEAMFKSNQKMMSVNQLDMMIDSFRNEKKTFPQKLTNQVNMQFAINKQKSKEDCNQESPTQALLEKWCIDHSNRLGVLEKSKNQIETIYNYADWSIKQADFLGTKTKKFEIALYDKFALSFACILLFLIGAPFGAIIRKGGLGLPMVLAIILFMFYYIFRTMGKKFAEEAVLPSIHGVWLPIYIMLPFSIYLVIKATNDSSMIQIDQLWARFTSLKIFQRFK